MKSNGQVSLECRNISHWFGTQQKILHDVNLRIFRGEIVAIVGETGAGKSTLLNMVLGTIRPRKGEILLHGQDGSSRTVGEPGPDRGVVFQHYSLFPFRTALENVLMGLAFEHPFLNRLCFFHTGWRRHCRAHREDAIALLEKVKLGAALDKYPHELSGGMRQRVAIAQALIKRPEILLLDEPFGALDEVTRRELQGVLLEFYRENCKAKERGEPPPFTIIIVTHELEEAILVSDRVVALSPHWPWEAEGFAECPGAKVVYDKVSRVDLPERDSRFEELAEQRMELRKAAFSATALKDGQNHVTFEQEVDAGNGRGIFGDKNGRKDVVDDMDLDFLSMPKVKISHDGKKAKRTYV